MAVRTAELHAPSLMLNERFQALHEHERSLLSQALVGGVRRCHRGAPTGFSRTRSFACFNRRSFLGTCARPQLVAYTPLLCSCFAWYTAVAIAVEEATTATIAITSPPLAGECSLSLTRFGMPLRRATALSSRKARGGIGHRRDAPTVILRQRTLPSEPPGALPSPPSSTSVHPRRSKPLWPQCHRPHPHHSHLPC